jgi:hypothetical protein
MAHDVFVCYSSEDKTIANAACAKLESAGIHCWMAPRDPIAGIPYGRQLVDAITAARIVLLIFSGNANRSEHVLRELEVASDSGKIIVPFRIENVTPSGDLRYYITRVHWLDAMSPPMEARLNELVALTQRLLDLPITPAVPAAARSSTRKGYPAIAGLAIIAVTVAIALGVYFMKHSTSPAVHAIAKRTPQPKRTMAAVAKHTAAAATPSTPVPPPPPTPQIVYVSQPAAQPVSATVKRSVPKKTAPKARATAKPVSRATVAPTIAPTIAPPVAAHAPESVRYRLPNGISVLVARVSAANWRVGHTIYATAGRANIAGTAGTSLASPNGRVWLFVPDVDADGPYAHQICFSNSGPGQCDANRAFPIIPGR